MTVCLAALCKYQGENIVVGASDCMITSGDTEFEPPHTKIHVLNNHTIIMFSGDVTYHATMMAAAFGPKQITDSMTTFEMAEIYAREFQNFRAKEAEAKFLKPLGVDLKTWASDKKRVPDLVIVSFPPLVGQFLTSNKL